MGSKFWLGIAKAAVSPIPDGQMPRPLGSSIGRSGEKYSGTVGIRVGLIKSSDDNFNEVSL